MLGRERDPWDSPAMSASVMWAEIPDGEAEDGADDDREAEVDETLATRRLRHWLRGMFGGGREPDETERD